MKHVINVLSFLRYLCESFFLGSWVQCGCTEPKNLEEMIHKWFGML